MMSLQRLHTLFDENPEKTAIVFEGACHNCGREVKVDISLTPEGFLIKGGAVYEPEPEKYFHKCNACFDIKPNLTDYQRCEVYSRVVGYLRPVSQWNDGKQAEFKDRKTFSAA